MSIIQPIHLYSICIATYSSVKTHGYTFHGYTFFVEHVYPAPVFIADSPFDIRLII